MSILKEGNSWNTWKYRCRSDKKDYIGYRLCRRYYRIQEGMRISTMTHSKSREIGSWYKKCCLRMSMKGKKSRKTHKPHLLHRSLECTL